MPYAVCLIEARMPQYAYALYLVTKHVCLICLPPLLLRPLHYHHHHHTHTHTHTEPRDVGVEVSSDARNPLEVEKAGGRAAAAAAAAILEYGMHVDDVSLTVAVQISRDSMSGKHMIYIYTYTHTHTHTHTHYIYIYI